jgi:EVE domain
MRYWIGVACYNHVLNGVKGGYCQLGHGKKSALEKMQADDWIIYYSPRQQLAPDSQTLQAFTAIGQILTHPTYQANMGDFKPWRRDVRFLEVAQIVPIRPLIESLSLSKTLHGLSVFSKTPRDWTFGF